MFLKLTETVIELDLSEYGSVFVLLVGRFRGVLNEYFAENVLVEGNFERVFENSDTLNGAELKKYLSHGILQLKYEKQQDSDYYIPRISASGK